jgi:hypothetical protein
MNAHEQAESIWSAIQVTSDRNHSIRVIEAMIQKIKSSTLREAAEQVRVFYANDMNIAPASRFQLLEYLDRTADLLDSNQPQV